MALVSFPGRNKPSKTCTECGREKPIEAFLDAPTNKDDKSGYCRGCHKKKRSRYIKNRTAQLEEQRKEQPEQSEVLKECTTCDTLKPKKDFGKCKKNPDGYDYECTVCMRKYKKEQRDKKKETVKKEKLPDSDRVFKVCTKHGGRLPLRLFKKSKTSLDGRTNWCKDCDNKYSRELRKKIVARIEEQRKSLPDQSEVPKTCNKCGKEKPTKDFVQNKMRLDRTGYMCKKCYCEYQAEWVTVRIALLEEVRAGLPDQSEVPKICIECGEKKLTKEFGDDKKTLDRKKGFCIVCANKKVTEFLEVPGNRERRNKRINKLRILDKGKQGKTHLNQQVLKRKQKDPLKARATQMQKTMSENARKDGIKLDPIFTVEKLKDMIEEEDYCRCCGTKYDIFYYGDSVRRTDVPSPDRINPELGYVVGNVVIICWRCNWIKNDGTADEFVRLAKWMADVYQKIEGKKPTPVAKTCTRCNVKKPVDEYGNLWSSSDGKSPCCKECLTEIIDSSNTDSPVRQRAKRIMEHTTSNSIKKKIDYDPALTLDKIHKMIEEVDRCPCCDRKIFKPIHGDNKRHYDSPSFDRFDPNVGYTEENVVVLCWRCNHLKNNATIQELWNIAAYITRYSPVP